MWLSGTLEEIYYSLAAERKKVEGDREEKCGINESEGQKRMIWKRKEGEVEKKEKG